MASTMACAPEIGVEDALMAFESGTEVELGHVIALASVGLEPDGQWVPRPLVDAIAARQAMGRDLANGGIDQVAWNHGPDAVRRYAAAFRMVGAIENADLLEDLAGALELRDAASSDGAVAEFMRYRHAVSRRCDATPALDGELREVLIEYAVSRASELTAAFLAS